MTITFLITMLGAEIKKAYPEDTLCQQYAWWMVQALTGLTRMQLIMSNTITLSGAQRTLLDQWIEQLVYHHKPLAYILGTVPFCGLDIRVAPPILIPRPETEEWCTALLEKLAPYAGQSLALLDLCTGTGCIALAIAKQYPTFQVVGVDINEQAVRLAQENAVRHEVANVTFIQSDLFSALSNEQMRFDLVVSNPPYIAPHEWDTLAHTVRQWEDPRALIADENGLDCIAQIIATAPAYLKRRSLISERIPSVWIEIGYMQATEVVELMQKQGYSGIQVFNDIAGKERVVVGSVSHAVVATSL
jgi:release factor glutamine methyltransferase